MHTWKGLTVASVKSLVDIATIKKKRRIVSAATHDSSEDDVRGKVEGSAGYEPGKYPENGN